MDHPGDPQVTVNGCLVPFNRVGSASLSAAIWQRLGSESLRITKPNGAREAFRKLIDDWAEWTIGTQIV
jgi:hypothetical protein